MVFTLISKAFIGKIRLKKSLTSKWGHKSSLPVPDVTRCYQLPEVHKNNNVEIDWTFWNMVNVGKAQTNKNHPPVDHPEEGYQPYR